MVAMHAVQNQTPMTIGISLPLKNRLSNAPVTKAVIIIKKPFTADAVPAAFPKGTIAPVWPHGWCMPCPTAMT